MFDGTDSPCPAQANLAAATALLPDGPNRGAAKRLAPEIIEYVAGIDYDTYFDTLVAPSAKQQSEFGVYSRESLQAARERLDKFLALFPADDVEAARERAAAPAF